MRFAALICSLGRSVGRSIAHSAAQSLDRSVDRAPLRDLWEPGRYESRFAPLPTPPELTICVIDEVRIAIRTAGQPIRAPEMCHWWGGTRCESRFAPLASQPEHRRCVIDISQKPLLKDVSNKNTTFTGVGEFVAGGGGEFPKIGVGGRIQEGETTLTHAFKTPKGVGGYIYVLLFNETRVVSR